MAWFQTVSTVLHVVAIVLSAFTLGVIYQRRWGRGGGRRVSDVETLARWLHEAGRAAVLANQVVNVVPGQGFQEWDALPERGREGRRIQARWLLERFAITRRTNTEGT